MFRHRVLSRPRCPPRNGLRFFSGRPTSGRSGNLTADGSWRYEWNGENRLVRMRTFHSPDTPQAGDQKLEFAYDFMGRRFSKKVYSYNATTANFELQTTTTFLYYGWNMVQEQTTDSQQQATTTKSYVWGLDLSKTLQGAGGVGGLLAQYEIPAGASQNAAYYALCDANGNIVAYTDASGTVAARYSFDAFGQKISATGSMAADFPFRFSSKYEDSETGLNYYGFRYYSPALGRWISRDPVGETFGPNLYAFVQNSPVSDFDLNGLLSFHWYGNWGGPGWANGGWNPEDGPLPDPGDPDYVPPIDERDACYEGHDRCIHGCPNGPCPDDRKARSNCMEGCDHALAQCLRDTGHRGLESWSFDTWIPWIIH